jgi:hypothetical protein
MVTQVTPIETTGQRQGAHSLVTCPRPREQHLAQDQDQDQDLSPGWNKQSKEPIFPVPRGFTVAAKQDRG